MSEQKETIEIKHTFLELGKENNQPVTYWLPKEAHKQAKEDGIELNTAWMEANCTRKTTLTAHAHLPRKHPERPFRMEVFYDNNASLYYLRAFAMIGDRLYDIQQEHPKLPSQEDVTVFMEMAKFAYDRAIGEKPEFVS